MQTKSLPPFTYFSKSFIWCCLILFIAIGSACAKEKSPDQDKAQISVKTPTKALVAVKQSTTVAKDTAKGKQQIIQQEPWDLANKLGQGIVRAAKRPKQTHGAFVSEVEALLLELIDFAVFAGNVMGKYAKADYANSLPAAKRKKLDTQIKQFAKTFQAQLIDVYSTTFWNVARKAALETLPLTPSTKPGKQVIRQRVLGVSETPVLIYYQLILLNNQWQIKNLAVQGVDLGKIYRQQFYNLMTEYKGDIDKVIDVWHVSS